MTQKSDSVLFLALDMIQHEGITFSVFKDRVSPLFEHKPTHFSEDAWVSWYKQYAEIRWKQNHEFKTSPEEWAVWQFLDWNLDEYPNRLKKEAVNKYYDHTKIKGKPKK